LKNSEFKFRINLDGTKLVPCFRQKSMGSGYLGTDKLQNILA